MTDRQTTHAHGCWDLGQRHYECAVREIKALRADLVESDEIREKLGHLLTRTAEALKGEPPEGTWHSWHDLPEKATQLVERAQRDKALLRQALETLEELRCAVVSAASTEEVSMYYRAIAALGSALAEPTCKESLQVAEQHISMKGKT